MNNKLKKTPIAFISALVAIFLITAYLFSENPPGTTKLSSTTETQVTATEKGNGRILLTSLEDDDFYLYYKGRTVFLVHQGQTSTFTNWSKMISASAPTMYYINVDADKEKELVIRIVSGTDAVSNKYIWDLYILNLHENKKGEISYSVTLASQDTWTYLLDNQIVEEVSQLKTCPKYVQFSMNAELEKPLQYDKSTGIAKNGYSGYFKALQNKDGSYMTLYSWKKGTGNYFIDNKNHICVRIAAYIYYRDSGNVQSAGNIYFEMELNKKRDVVVRKHSMVFEAADEYRVSNPKNVGKEKFLYEEKNIAVPEVSAKKIISDVDYKTQFSQKVDSRNVELNDNESEIKYVSDIKITEKYIELTAMEGYEFDNRLANSDDFKVNIIDDKDLSYDIAYDSVVITDNGKSTMRINFDKQYERSSIKSMSVRIG